jgi:hypothetical protein
MSMSEHIEGVVEGEITDEAIAGFIDRGGEMPSFHPILQVWREVLKPAREEKDARVTPAWANRIIASYQGLTFADMNHYRDSYFAKILELADLLDEEIASDDECLNPATPEEDAEENSDHYKNLLLVWQKAVLGWEMGWDTAAPGAAVEVAAISEVHKMFFGETGIVAFLDNIKFEFTEADQNELAAELEAMKAGSSE